MNYKNSEDYWTLLCKYNKLKEMYVKLDDQYHKLINQIDEDFWYDIENIYPEL